MKPDIHTQTQELIATGEISSLSGESRRRVHEHLNECDACRDFGEALGGLERALHSISIAADSSLVSATRARVHHRAAELELQRQRLWIVNLSLTLVVLSTLLTTPLLLQAFAWVGGSLHLASLVWQAGFVMFWIVPSLLVSVLMAAFGTHWSDRRAARE